MASILLAWSVLIVGTAFVATAACVCAYHLALLAVAACSVGVARGHGKRDACTTRHSFAIVIPAHNEEATVFIALDSCAALDYPATKCTIYVIADNCSDRTAEVAKSLGATCLVRRDEERRGKGFALAWALPQVLAAGHDAVVVLDADCRIDRHALLVFDRWLTGGARVLQANDIVANPDAGATSYALAVANVLENDGFYAPKSALGLAVFLRGTGMVFHRDVLLQFPWRAESIVEDAEYTCHLLAAGITVRFVPDVHVISDFPIEREQLGVQRARWIGGGLRVAAGLGPRLIGQGLCTGRIVLLDAALTMVVTSRPLVIGQFLASLVLVLLGWWWSPGPWADVLLLLSLGTAAAYTIYAAAGVAMLGVDVTRIRLLLQLPLVAAGYLAMAVRELSRRNATGWNRTPRKVAVVVQASRLPPTSAGETPAPQ